MEFFFAWILFAGAFWYCSQSPGHKPFSLFCR
jgi:hypothetical protein